MTLADWTHGYRGAICASVAVFIVAFAWLYQAPLLVPYQGVHSLLAARSLNEGRGFEVVPGMPFAKFGPFYPLALSVLGRLGLEPGPSVYLLNCAAFAGTLLGLYALSRMLGVRRRPAVLALWAVLAANFYLLRSARPDLLVVCAATLGLAAMVAYVRRPTIGTVLLAGLWCGIAATSRYVAVLALLPMFFVALWLAGGPWKHRLRDLFLFGLVSAGPVLLWLARNQHVTGYLTGMSRTRTRLIAGGGHSFGEQFQGMLSTVWLDFFSPDTIGLRQVIYRDVEWNHKPWMTLAALVAGGAFLAVVWSRKAELREFVVRQSRERTTAHAAAVLVGGYVLLYTVVLLTVWTLTNNDPIHTRYVSPMYGYLFALAALPFAVRGEAATARWPRVAALLILMSIGLPNLPKSRDLLGYDAPNGTLMYVRSVGERGRNWIDDLSWRNLDEIRPLRADAVSAEP